MRVVLGLIVGLAGASGAWSFQEIVMPKEVGKIPESIELKQARASLSLVRAKLGSANPYRKFTEQRFALANAFYTMWNAKTHPIYAENAAALEIGAAYLLEKQRYDAELDAFNRDQAAYRATPITDDNREAMAAWKQRLVEWEARGKEWEGRLGVQRLEAARILGEASERAEAAENEWREQLRAFDAYARGALRIGEIDAKIVALDARMKQDRTALDRWKNQLPGFYKDVEGMAKEAESTRAQNAQSAIGLGFSLAIDATTMNNLAKETVAREQIKRVKDVLTRGGVRPDHVKQLLSGWDGPGSVKSMRSARAMIESLGQLMDFAAALDTADQHKYWEALAAALSIFVQHPVLKLIKTNIEVYTNLLHTGLAYATAKARVDQFSKLSDTQLAAVDKLAKLAVGKIRERAKLAKEKESLRIQFGWETRSPDPRTPIRRLVRNGMPRAR